MNTKPTKSSTIRVKEVIFVLLRHNNQLYANIMEYTTTLQDNNSMSYCEMIDVSKHLLLQSYYSLPFWKYDAIPNVNLVIT